MAITPEKMRGILRRLEELEKNATGPPWQAESSGDVVVEGDTLCRFRDSRDALFIASVRNELGKLLELAEQTFALAQASSDLLIAEELDSEPAQRLHRALKNIGFHDDAGEPCFRD